MQIAKMNGVIRTAGLSVVALALVGFAAYRHVSAQERPETAKRSAPVLTGEPDVAGINHALERTYINSAAPEFFSSVPSGPQPIDPLTTIFCPGTSGTCTIEFDQSIQLYATSSSPDSVSLCAQLDSSSFACPTLLQPLPAPGTYFHVAFSQEISGVPHGYHTIQSILWTGNGIDAAYYTFAYRVYKP
ncbi:MAG: hypothetical protein WCB11_12300 [Terriglobales bacterium]|jgi:hypothetical protein